MNVLEDFKCKNCGASDFQYIEGKYICNYCGSVYQSQAADTTNTDTTISLGDDVQSLLNKMRDDPANARLYANLILDIDPTNTDIQKYL